jgi:MFS family permease
MQFQGPIPPAPEEVVVAPGGWLRTFAALRLRDYRWYWLGTLASFFGMQIQWPTQAWLAYELTHSPFKLGLVSAAWGFPVFIFSLFGGVITDRVQKRNLLIVSQACIALITLVVAILISTGLIQYWHLLAAALFSGVTFSFNMPARQAIVPEIVPRETLFNAIVLSSGGMNVTRVAGPAIAGVLISIIGTDGAYYCALGFNLISVALIAKLPLTSKVGLRPGISMLKDLTEGLKYMRAHTLILTLLGMEVMLVLFGMPFQSLMPVFAELFEVEALGFGFLMAMVGIGALAGSLGIASLGDFKRKGQLLLIAGITFGGTLILFANAHALGYLLNMQTNSFYLALFFLMLVGATSTAYMSTNNTLIQMNITDEIRGRVMSVYMMIFGLMPLGALPAGALAESFGAPFPITLGGAVLAIFMLLITFLRPRVRHLE